MSIIRFEFNSTYSVISVENPITEITITKLKYQPSGEGDTRVIFGVKPSLPPSSAVLSSSYSVMSCHKGLKIPSNKSNH